MFILLPVKAETFADIQKIDMNTPLKNIGEDFAYLAEEIILKIFAPLIDIVNHHQADSHKVLQDVVSAFHTYLPWTAERLTKERVKPVIDYLKSKMGSDHGYHYIRVAFTPALEVRIRQIIERFNQGEPESPNTLLKTLIDIIDLCVHDLLVEPKKLLKFNFVIDKTLNGVIQFTTKLAYRQLMRLETKVDVESTREITAHLLQFLEQ